MSRARILAASAALTPVADPFAGCGATGASSTGAGAARAGDSAQATTVAAGD